MSPQYKGTPNINEKRVGEHPHKPWQTATQKFSQTFAFPAKLLENNKDCRETTEGLGLSLRNLGRRRHYRLLIEPRLNWRNVTTELHLFGFCVTLHKAY